MALATQDVEKIEYFFAHTVAPAFVAVLVPGAVVATLMVYGWSMALALTPFLVMTALAPFFMRGRIDRLGSRAREALAELNAHAVDTIQGLAEIVAFQQAERRGAEFIARIRACHRLRLPFFSDLTIQTAILEMATGLGGLAVIVAGANLVGAGHLDSGLLPLLALLAMSAFLPVSEIANVGRQLAETLGATRRVYAVHDEPVTIEDGPGVMLTAQSGARPGGAVIEVEAVDYSYFGANRPALSQVSFSVPAGGTLALVGPSGAGKTTLAQLMMRFWDPDAGTIRMNGGICATTGSRICAAASRWSPRTPICSTRAWAPISGSRGPRRARPRCRRRSRARRFPNSWRACPRASTRRSASVACGFPVASASASPLPAPSSRTRRS
jgi:ATP-binding cassette subfamily C protein CydCD